MHCRGISPLQAAGRGIINNPWIRPRKEGRVLEVPVANYAVDIDALESSRENKQDFASLFRKAE
jgi:hypothetical protein